MNIRRQNGTLTIHNLKEMSAANAQSLRDEISAAYSPGLEHVEIDMSQLSYMDGYGLGALASLYALVNSQSTGVIPIIRLLHPQPPVQQILELTRMHDIFEIISNEEEAASDRATPQFNPSPATL
jgi:anti-sigma B factor antagonist